MKRAFLVIIMLGVVLCLPRSPSPQAQEGYLANTPLPTVPIPPDNPQTDAKILLGKQLYFETRLSADNTISCATCHAPSTAWANHGKTDTGIRGQVGGRNSGTIIDAAYMRYQFWDGRAGSLEEQALGPIHNPIEMGETLENVVKKLNDIPGYHSQFQQVFGTDANTDGIAKAIAAFERTIVTGPSPFDRYKMGEKSALNAAAVRGMDLFNGKAHCSSCHSGPAFSDQGFHNLGVGYKDGKYSDVGRYAVTKNSKDMGSFKTPGLRNAAETWPYLHDGSEKTLMDVINLYDRGGVQNPNLDPMMLPLHLTANEKQDLEAFLNALTGPVPAINPPKLPE
ncbi:MAG: cytochrome-c peroxidase [bacterium]|nr:cytochrome-c peroxidase [bacterium]